MDKTCPYCAETIKAAAIKCRYCQSDVSVQSQPALAAPVSPSAPSPSVPDRQSTDEVAMRFEVEKKSVGVAYFLWLIFGTLGGPRFYLGHLNSAGTMAAIALSSIFLLFAGGENSTMLLLGALGYAVVAAWALVDAFQIPGWTKEFNTALLSQLRANPSGEVVPELVMARPTPVPSQLVSVSICPKCRAQGNGNDTQCGRCGHMFATAPAATA